VPCVHRKGQCRLPQGTPAQFNRAGSKALVSEALTEAKIDIARKVSKPIEPRP
jgi:hypothetical protein